MAKYKVWFTVKDNYGKTKEVEGGTIDVDLDLNDLSQDEIACIEEALPLEEYIKRKNLDTELVAYATDVEVEHVVQNKDTIRYADFELQSD